MKADGLYSSLLLRNLLASSDDNNFFVRLGKQFQLMGTKKSVIYLANASIESHSGQIRLPECLYLAMVQTGSKVETYAKKDAPPIYKGMLPQFMQEAGRPVSYLNFLLFYQNVQYGMLCVEAGAAEADFYSMLAVDIGSALRYLDVFLAWGRVQTVLEKQNQLLDYAASHDELTGLYNRAGILARANMFALEEHGEGSFCAVMADLDHLKQINDSFGHVEGDSALRIAAKILEESLPEGGLLGRTGGDEFSIIFFSEKEAEAPQYEQRVREACELYNHTSLKPYYIGISVGYKTFGYERRNALSAMFQEADSMLYEAKKSRRPNVVRRTE